jgi:hypothetical protein
MGDGPFPAVVYNHGSEQTVGLFAGPQGGYGNIGTFYAGEGFVVLVPLRRGHTFRFNRKPISTSEGTCFNGHMDMTVHGKSVSDQYNRNLIWLQMQDADNEDVAAGVTWLGQQPYVDADALVMSGVSFRRHPNHSYIREKSRRQTATSSIRSLCLSWVTNRDTAALPLGTMASGSGGLMFLHSCMRSSERRCRPVGQTNNSFDEVNAFSQHGSNRPWFVPSPQLPAPLFAQWFANFSVLRRAAPGPRLAR